MIIDSLIVIENFVLLIVEHHDGFRLIRHERSKEIRILTRIDQSQCRNDVQSTEKTAECVVRFIINSLGNHSKRRRNFENTFL